MSKYVKNILKNIQRFIKTHQKRGPGALGVLNSESTRKMRYGAGNVCFRTETCGKNVWKWHENGMLMVCEWY